MVLETKRLLLRDMNPEDYEALFRVLGDPETMWHYPYTFDGQHVRDWIERNIKRYRKDGFGLWAVCLRDTGEMIGDCGLTLQNINGEILPEIGYHIRRDCQRKGYAREAAMAVRNWAFQNTDYPALYSYCKYTNIPSIKTAESIGMGFDREYPDEVNGTTHVSVIRREDLIENMIHWAETRLGSTKYAGWCLSFIEDALEKSNEIEVFGGDSAKESALLYADGMRQGMPERGAFVFYDCICQGSDGPVNWGHCGISLGDGKIIHAWDTVRIDDYREIEAMTALSGNHPQYIGWVPVDRVLMQNEEDCVTSYDLKNPKMLANYTDKGCEVKDLAIYMGMNYQYKRLDKHNFTSHSLDEFVRHQTVAECWRKIDNDWNLVPNVYEENWSQMQCREIAEDVVHHINLDQTGFGAFDGERIIGFATVSHRMFGAAARYVQLVCLQISEEYRRQGIGRKLFSMACEEARRLGADKLYISAHSSKESQAAYRALGCSYAEEINEELAAAEPFDVQMEYRL